MGSVAWGGYAVAPFSIGAIAIGLFAVAAQRGCYLTGTRVSVDRRRCMAAGVKAYGWFPRSAGDGQGSGSPSPGSLRSPVHFAQHANDLMARQILTDPHAEQTR